MTPFNRATAWRAVCSLVLVQCCMAGSPCFGATLQGELKTWHRITLTFDGPQAAESGTPNPFRDYRLTVTFKQGDKQYRIPGFFAADGNAAQTGAEAGNQWRVHFSPDTPGTWQYEASFRQGENVALSREPDAGEPAAFDGTTGSFDVQPTDKMTPDYRAHGRLSYVGGHYYQFAGSGDFYLKGGADSPENFLAYFEFDQTPVRQELPPQEQGEARQNTIHRYEPHAKDWRQGDPTWKNGKGRNIIGAINYLAGKGMNCLYFLTMNVGGDGDDVWPWSAKEERFRFDCSKLDQWEIVFSHMTEQGILLHVLTQETENDQLLDGGELGPERKLYYRELIARFAHHPALIWNLGEENTNTDAQRKAFARYFHQLDPYDHPVMVHTYPGQYDKVYTPLLGFDAFEGPSLQMGDMTKTHAETIQWIDRSADTGRPWVVNLDEIGPANTGVKPDADDYWHDDVRRHALWGNLMAGGGGCEWYFGYNYAHNDLNCEDWRSRDHMWDLTRYALEFFHDHLPFPEMTHHDDLIEDESGYCLAKPGAVYAVYLPHGNGTALQLEEGSYSIHWYNPREGGVLQTGSKEQVTGPGKQEIGQAPDQLDRDWAALVRKTD